MPDAEAQPTTEMTVSLVVRSSRLSGPQLVALLGGADEAWSRGDRKSLQYSVWEIRESKVANAEVGSAILKLLARAERVPSVVRDLCEAGEVDPLALWILIETGDERAGLSLKAEIIAPLAHLGASIEVSVLCAVGDLT